MPEVFPSNDPDLRLQPQLNQIAERISDLNQSMAQEIVRLTERLDHLRGPRPEEATLGVDQNSAAGVVDGLTIQIERGEQLVALLSTQINELSQYF